MNPSDQLSRKPADEDRRFDRARGRDLLAVIEGTGCGGKPETRLDADRYRLLAAADLEPRIRLLPYDAHDDVLDALAARDPATQAELERARDDTLTALDQSRPEWATPELSTGKQRVG